MFTSINAFTSTGDGLSWYAGDFNKFSVQIDITGNPLKVVIAVDGSTDQSTWVEICEHTAEIPSDVFHVEDNVYDYYRLSLKTLSAGSSPTVTGKFFGQHTDKTKIYGAINIDADDNVSIKTGRSLKTTGITDEATEETLILDDLNHVGIGAQPNSGWGSAREGVQCGDLSIIDSDGVGETNMWFNAYHTGTSVRHISNGKACRLRQTLDKVQIYFATTGVADGAAVFVESARFDDSATAGNTRFMIYDVDNATLERVTVGAADSGGAGYKLLRIAN